MPTFKIVVSLKMDEQDSKNGLTLPMKKAVLLQVDRANRDDVIGMCDALVRSCHQDHLVRFPTCEIEGFEVWEKVISG